MLSESINVPTNWRAGAISRDMGEPRSWTRSKSIPRGVFVSHMRSYRSQTFSGQLTDWSFSDATFDRCTFDNCAILHGQPGERRVIRNVTLRDATQRACLLSGVCIEDTSIHGLKKLGRVPLFLDGAVFKHVTLSGRISAIKINRELHAPALKSQTVWDDSCAEYYSGVDWALDIHDAEFQGGVTFEALPGALVRRDPATQVLVTRQKLVASDWKGLTQNNGGIRVAISWFLEFSIFDDCVLVAPKAAKYFEDDLATFDILRREGVAS